MDWKKVLAIIGALSFLLMVFVGIWLVITQLEPMKQQAQAQKLLAAPVKPPVSKKAVVKVAPVQTLPAPAQLAPVTVNVYPPLAPAPVAPDVTINVYPPPVTQPVPAPAPPAVVPAPAPAPTPTPAPPASVYPQPMPPVPAPVSAPVTPPTPRKTTVNILSGNSLSINILSSVGGGGYGSGVAYGYGTRWVPGYQRWVCEGPPPPAGPGCYWKWEPAHYE